MADLFFCFLLKMALSLKEAWIKANQNAEARANSLLTKCAEFCVSRCHDSIKDAHSRGIKISVICFFFPKTFNDLSDIQIKTILEELQKQHQLKFTFTPGAKSRYACDCNDICEGCRRGVGVYLE